MFPTRGLPAFIALAALSCTSSSERGVVFNINAGVFHQSPLIKANFSCPKVRCSPLCCARACVMDELCALFSYSKTLCACVLSERQETNYTSYDIPDVLWNTYERECPGSEGYTLYTTPQPNVCLKYVTTPLSHSAADDYCKTDGARLVRVKTQDIWDAVYQARIDYPGFVWVGAEDQVEGQHYWNDGTYLPLNDPLWGQGEGLLDVEDCVMAKVDGLGDQDCTVPNPFVCQYRM